MKTSLKFLQILFVVLCFFTSHETFSQTTVTVGNGTLVNTSTTYPAPYGNYYKGAKHQMLVAASEIIAAGGYPGQILSLAFDVVTANGAPLNDFEIKMGETTITDLTTWQTGLTSVYYASSYTETAGWNVHNFSTPFNWTGNNLIIEVCFDNGSGSTYTNNAIVNQTSTSYASTINYHSDLGGVCASTSISATDYQRPNIQFVFAPNGDIDAGVFAVTNPVSPTVPGISNIEVVVKNYGLDTLTNVDINWEFNGVPGTTFNYNDTILPSDVTSSLLIGTGNFVNGYNTIKAWTSNPNFLIDTLNYNDTLEVQVYACDLLNGTYTIGGTSPDFNTINEAITALSNCGVNGPVVFDIRPGTYNEQVVIPEIIGVSNINTITFQSETGDSTDVLIQWASSSSSTNNFTLELDGADYIILKHLTIQRTGTESYSNVLALENNATHNVITNCQIIGQDINSSSINHTLIYSSTNGTEDSTIITYNKLLYGANAIYFDGTSSARESKILVKGNIITGFSYYGIRLEYVSAPVVTQNEMIANEINAYSTQYGVYLYYCNDSLQITKNKLTTYGTSTNYGFYTYYCDALGTEGLVTNNFYTQLAGTGTVYGIYIYNSNYIRAYHNSVHITAGSTTSSGAYLYSSSSAYGNIAFQNNNIVNHGGGYAIYFSSSAVTYGYVVKCDFNNLYTTGTVLGNYGGTTCADLTTWQTTSNFDFSSISIEPVFNSVDDLHTFSIELNAAGTPILAVGDDIDGESRDPATPDIGADEFTPASYDAGVVSVDNPVSPAYIGINNVEVSIRNFGTDTITSVDIEWEVNGVPQTTYNWTGTLAPASNAGPILLGTANLINGINEIKAWTSNPNLSTDGNYINDTIVVSINACNLLSGNYTIGATGDYLTINDAINAMTSCGVGGPVVFDIQSGTYNEQVSVPEIPGASATNNIIFQSQTGNNTDVIIDWPSSSSSTDNYTLQFNGADYVTFQNLTIQRSGNNSYARVVVFENGATSDQLINNRIVGQEYSGTSTNYTSVYSPTTLDTAIYIANNIITGGAYCVHFDGTSSAQETNIVIQDNEITDWSYYGIRLEYSPGAIVSGNTVKSHETSSYSSVYGVYMYYCDSNIVVSKNNIMLNGTSSNYGIYIYYCDGGPNKKGLVSNNFISQLKSTTGTVYGIYPYYSNYQNIYNNSIHITSGSLTTGRGIYAYSASSGSYGNIAIQNNNVVNEGGGLAIEISSGAATLGYVVKCDFNNFYSTGSAIGEYSDVAQADLTAWQTNTGFDMNSISVPVVFTTNSNLHTYEQALNGAGTPVPEVIDDIDNEPRDPATPDIGADEFTPATDDAGVISVDAPQTANVGLNQVEVTIRNFGLNNLTSCDIEWELNGVPQATYNWTGNLASATNDGPIAIGNGNFISGYNTLKVWTSNPNSSTDGNNTNDTIEVSIYACDLMSGTFTIGATGDFATINDAVDSLLSCGINGPVIFNIESGTYNEQVAIPEINGASSVNTITFQSLSGNNTDVIIDWPTSTSSTNNYTILFDGADHVIIKDVTIKRTGSDTYGEVVVFDNGANFNELNNNIIVGSTVGGSSTYSSVIYSNTANDSGNKIIGNNISYGSSAFYLDGTSSAPEYGWEIKDNNVHDFTYYGVRLEYATSTTIQNNIFSASQTSAYSTNYGIYLYYCDSAQIIDKNKIELRGTSSNYGIYHYYCDGVFGYEALITNNFIAKLSSTTGTTYGIYSYYSNYGKIYNNSIHITSSSITSGNGIYVSSSSTGTYGNVQIKNNNIVNSGGGYAIQITSSAVTLGYVTACDYNNLYTTGSNVANYGGTTCADLAAWQAASGLDAHSVSVDPGFASASDLHVYSTTVDGLGSLVPEVTDDIDGDLRDAVTPDIGADEFTPSPIDVGVTELIAPQSNLCYSSTESIIVCIKNFGTDTVDFSLNPLAVNAVTSGVNPVVFPTVNITSGLLPTGDTLHVLITNTYDMSVPGTYYFDASATLTGDGNANNDTMTQVSIDVLSPLVAPATETFETFTPGSPGTFANGWTTAATGSYVWQVNSGTTSSTLTGPNVDHTLGTSSGIYVYTEASSGSQGDEAYLISPCLDLSGIPVPQLSFWYHMYGSDIYKLCVDVMDGGTWYEAYSISGQHQTSESDPWQQAVVSLAYYSNPQKIRFRGIRGASYEGDIAIDDINIDQAPDFDMAVTSIISPSNGCGLTSAESISIEVLNAGAADQDSIPVVCSINGGAITLGPEYIYSTIPAGTLVIHTFSQTVDMSALGTTYDIVAYIDTTDATNTNDTAIKSVYSNALISTFPYYQDFEGTQYWTAQGVNSTWALGTPAGTTIIGAASGVNAWMTGLSSAYLANDNSWVLSPCFDFSSLVQPVFEMDIWVNSEDDFDGAVLQYSLDGGDTWTTVGNFMDPVYWYNDPSVNGLGYTGGTIGWSGDTLTGWIHVKHDLDGLGGASSVNLRIAFGSDGSIQYDGFAFDNVFIHETPNKDLAVTQWLAPMDDCMLTSNESITIRIENQGIDPQSNFPVSYSIDGGNTWITNEIVTATINPGATLDYTFTTPADFSIVGAYDCYAAVTDLTDEVHQNDTLQHTVNISGIQIFPYVEDFETAVTGTPGILPAQWHTSSNSNYVWYVHNGATPTAMTGPSKDHTLGVIGGHYVYTEADNGSAGDTAYLYLPCADMTNYSTPALMFWYHMYGSNIDTLYVDVFDNGWINDIYHIGGQQDTSATDPWQKATVDLTPYVNATEIRFRAIRGNGNLGDIAIDDIQILEPSYDIGVSEITSPSSQCVLYSFMQVSIKITNYGTLDYPAGDTIHVALEFNGAAPVTGNVILSSPFMPGSTISYLFPQAFDMSTVGAYDLIAYTLDPNDVDNANDTTTKIVYHYGSPAFSLGSDIITNQPDTVVLDAGTWANYLWMDSVTTQLYNVDSAGYYWVEVTDTNGCTAMDTIYVGPTVNVNHMNAYNQHSIYPNPNNGIFTLEISLADKQDVRVELLDVKGELLFVRELKSMETYKEDFDFTNLAAGVYYMKIKTSGKVYLDKVIIK